jgi:microcystin-dependent protein
MIMKKKRLFGIVFTLALTMGLMFAMSQAVYGAEGLAHTHTIGVHTHAHTIVAKTPSLSHSITQPAFTYNRVNPTSGITSGSGDYFKTGRGGATNMSRSANLAISNHPATACTMSGGVTDCPAFDTETAGSGDAHNNMMPYIALVYLIQAEPDVPPGPIIPSMVLFNGALPVGPSGAYIAGRK